MAFSFYQRVQGIILVYDVCDTETFKSLTYWLKKIKEHANDDPEIILLGHKIDKKNDVKVSEDEAKAFSEENNLKYFKTTCEDVNSIDGPFLNLLSNIIKNPTL